MWVLYLQVSFIYPKIWLTPPAFFFPLGQHFVMICFWINHNFLYFSSDSYRSMAYRFLIIWTLNVLYDSANIELKILFVTLCGQFSQLLFPWHTWSAYFPRPSGFCNSSALCGTNVPFNRWSIKPAEISKLMLVVWCCFECLVWTVSCFE